MKPHQISILGAGGHARETCDLAKDCGWQVTSYVDTASSADIDGVPVLSESEMQPGPCVLGIGSAALRAALYARFAAQCTFPVLVHPAAYVSRTATLSSGVTVQFGCFLGSRVRLGTGVLTNYNVSIGHDSEIGDFSTILPGAAISGGVRISRGSSIGAGAVILPGIIVGTNATVGAGAVVTKDVPPHATVTGVPARTR